MDPTQTTQLDTACVPLIYVGCLIEVAFHLISIVMKKV